MLTLQKKLRVPSFGRKASSTKRAAAFGEGGNSAGGIRASSSHRSQQFTLADFSGRVRWACSASSCRARRRVCCLLSLSSLNADSNGEKLSDSSTKRIDDNAMQAEF